MCNGNDDCAFDGTDGVCQPTGACSFPDDACDSGQRYAKESRPSLAGECVQHETEAMASTTGEPDPDDSTTGGPSSESTDGADADDDDDDDDDETPGDTNGAQCPADWWDCAWGARQRLSLARPVGELQSVPVLVLLGPDRADFASMQADGEDVRFVSADGTDLPYELETFDPEGLSFVWVGVDRLGGDADHLWLYYDNPVAERPGREAEVWSASYVGVWHLHDDLEDATSLANHGVAVGELGPAPGQLADGHQLFESAAHVDVEPSESLEDVFVGGGTVSAWIRPDGWGGGSFGRIANKADADGWLFYVGSVGRLRFAYRFDADVSRTWTTPPDVLPLHTWSHVAVTYDATGPDIPRIYVNGTEAQHEEPPMQPGIEPVSDGESRLTIANRPDHQRRFNGVLDEIRLATTMRSPEWVAVQHDSTQDGLLTFGDIERQEAQQ